MTIRFRVSPGPRIRARVAGRIDPLEAALRNTGTAVQWRIGADGEWQDLILIDDINASVSIGTVTTLAAGSDATVTNVGTAADAVLDFAIPRGADGSDGADGADGADGQITTIVAGTGIAVDDTDPGNPEVSVVASLADLSAQWTAAGTAAAASLAFAEDADNGTNKVTVTAPDSLSGDVTVTLPSATGTLALTTAASDSAPGLIEIAVQSEMETGSDTTRAVTPGRQHFHQSAAKIWVRFNASTGTPTIVSSYNVTSLTDVGVGITTVVIGTDFSGNTEAIWAACGNSGARHWVDIADASAGLAGSFNVVTARSDTTLVDCSIVCAGAFGDQ